MSCQLNEALLSTWYNETPIIIKARKISLTPGIIPFAHIHRQSVLFFQYVPELFQIHMGGKLKIKELLVSVVYIVIKPIVNVRMGFSVDSTRQETKFHRLIDKVYTVAVFNFLK